MRAPIRWLAPLLLAIAMHGGPLRAAELTLAIEPFLSARTLLAAFQPYATFLGDKAGEPVLIVGAANYDQYMQRLLRSEFDIALIGPHSALLAVQNAGYVAVMKGEGSLKAIMIVDKASAYQKPEDMKGQLIALPDHLTLTSMLGAEFFRQPDGQTVDVRFKYNDYHNTAAMMMLHGEAAAAVIADSALQPMAPDIRNNIRIIAESKPVPQMVLLIHSRLTPELRARLVGATQEFMRSADPKRNLLARVGFSAGKPLADSDMRQIAPYIDELRKRLGQ